MTENMKKMHGIFGLISMTYDEKGEVDLKAFEKLAEYLTTKTGMHGIGLYGMVSEFHKLTDYEKTDLTEIFLDVAQRNKMTSLLSITDFATDVAVKKAKNYEKMGADSLMLLPPSFLNPTIDEIRNHMIRVVEAVGIPVVLQYAPQATGLYMENEELVGMAEKYDNCAFKIEYKPAIGYLKPFLDAKPDMVILTGYAGLEMMDLYDIGVKGVMPACSFTELYMAIHSAYEEGDRQKANALYLRLEHYLKDCDWMNSPESLLSIEKEILKRRGVIPCSYNRRPAYHVTEQNSRDIDAFLGEFKEILPIY